MIARYATTETGRLGTFRRQPQKGSVRYFNILLPLCSFVIPLLLLSGCSKEAPGWAVSPEPVLSRQYRQGSVTVIVAASETNILTAGKIELMIDVHAPPAAEVVFPDVAYCVEPFSVADGYSEPIQLLQNGKHHHRRVWTLLPSLPGEVIFQSLEISAGSVSVKTEPIKVLVTSLLPQDLDSFEIKDIAEPVALLPEEKQKQTLWLILSVTAVVIAIATLIIKRICRPKRIIAPAPHETAFRALENLPDNELEKIHALTEILLAFIGGRFTLPTSARTVNEILPLLPQAIPPERNKRLEKFLLDSEQIRFSNKVPAGFTGEFERYVCSFVEEMKEAPCD